MPISHVYTLADLPARIIFVPVLYIIFTPVLLTTSHIHSMILRVISSSSRFLPLSPYSPDLLKRFYREKARSKSKVPPKTTFLSTASQKPVTVQQDKRAQYLSEDVVGRFPRLSYMALDFLTTSSSSAETERYSSSVGRITAPLRDDLLS